MYPFEILIVKYIIAQVTNIMHEKGYYNVLPTIDLMSTSLLMALIRGKVTIKDVYTINHHLDILHVH